VGVSKTWALRLGLVLAVAYLGAQALGGRQGLVSLMALKERDRALTLELAELRAETAQLEAQALALRQTGPAPQLAGHFVPNS
jgi:cell division protein FtsB